MGVIGARIGKMILVDTREYSRAKKVIRVLKAKGAKLEEKALDAGDYLVPSKPSDFLIERKTCTDMVGSLKSGRLFEQLDALKRVEGAQPIFLIEGSYAKLKKYSGWSLSSLMGLINSIYLDWNIPVFFSDDQVTTAHLLMSLEKRLEKERKPYEIRMKPKLKTLDEKALFVVCGLPNVGPTLGDRLLREFGTIRNIANASKEELAKVDGIGRTIARKIYEVLNHVYRGCLGRDGS